MKWPLIPIIVASLFFSFAHAEVYKWTDEKGTIHFTDDPATIPPKYQDQAEGKPTEEDLLTIEERMRIKERDQAEAQRRMIKDQVEYERSIREEEKKGKARQAEIDRDIEKLSREREEKTRYQRKSLKEEKPEYIEKACWHCGGKGYITCSFCNGTGYDSRVRQKCSACRGKGWSRCSECNARGYILKRTK